MMERYEKKKKKGGGGVEVKRPEEDRNRVLFLSSHQKKPKNEYFHFLGSRALGSIEELRKKLFLIFPKKTLHPKVKETGKSARS